MAKFVQTLAAVFFISVILLDLAVGARYCEPECDWGQRCMSRDRLGMDNICVASRCLERSRRGRCYGGRRRYYFDRTTMTCQSQRSGTCYRGNNQFYSHEDCQLACFV